MEPATVDGEWKRAGTDGAELAGRRDGCCSDAGADGAAGSGWGRARPVGDQHIDVEGAEAGGQIVARAGGIADGAAVGAVGSSLRAGNGDVAGDDVVEDARGSWSIGEAVQRWSDVAEGSGAKLLFDQSENAGERWRDERGSAKDIGLAVRREEAIGAGALAADDVSIVLRGGVERDIRDVARRVVGNAKPTCHAGLEKKPLAPPPPAPPASRPPDGGGLIPGHLRDIGCLAELVIRRVGMLFQ